MKKIRGRSISITSTHTNRDDILWKHEKSNKQPKVTEIRSRNQGNETTIISFDKKHM